MTDDGITLSRMSTRRWGAQCAHAHERIMRQVTQGAPTEWSIA